jgi:alkanesulfonate monooxygenase SsuD/methylene tetrahydromethanopterin reductase-like flavin-dependent oxidoreductase (luciferase family)
MDVCFLTEIVHREPGDRRPLVELYDEAFKLAEWFESLGLDLLLLGEHHFMEKQWNTSPLLLLAGFAKRTSKMRLGINVLLTPFYEPVRLAEDIATLDLISHGRADIIFGTASVSGEFETFRQDPKERHGRTFEVMEFVKKSFATDQPFDHNGKYFQIPNVRTTTQPVQKPFPMWFGGFGPKNLHRAGVHGYFVGAPLEGPYSAGLKEGGHDPDKMNTMTQAGVICVGSEKEIPAMQQSMGERMKAMGMEYAATRDVAFENVKPGQAMNMPQLFVGTPDQVLDHLESRLKNSSATHILGGITGFHASSWVVQNRKSVELYLKEVAPSLRKWGRAPVAKRAVATA